LPEGERRLAAIMFTDMVGYSALTQSNESLALEVLDRHNRMLRPFFTKFRGKEIKTIGDSFLVEFESALDATNCAVEIQRFLHDYNISSRNGWKITLRIGIHLGDVVHSGNDILGDAVNIASRLQPLAQPEGICVSDQVYGQVRNKIPQAFEKMAPQDLKNIKFPVDAYRVVLPWETKPAEPVAELDRRRVAILPFANMSPDPADSFFADGITEEIISTVSNLSGLTVISRTSVMGYKGTTKKVKEIGNELEAGSVLEGSLRKMGNRLRITTQLIDANNDGHMWAQNYDREMDDVFAIQSDIARQVADALKVKILPEEGRRISRAKTRNIEAYTSYLKGVRTVESGTGEYKRAEKFFLEAVALDPGYAEAYSGLAMAYMEMGVVGQLNPKDAYEKTFEAAQKALSLDDSLAESHTAMASAFHVGMMPEGALREYDRAVELNPNYELARRQRAYYLSFFGRFEESIADFKKAAEIDPVGSGPHAGATIVLLGMGDIEGSRREAQRAVEVDPFNLNALSVLAYIALKEGSKDEAIRMFESLAEHGGQSWEGYLGFGYAMLGRRDDALKILDRLEARSKTSYVAPTIPAMVCAGLGDKDRTFDLLKRAAESKDPQICFLGTDYTWFGLRSDPRFIQILKSIGLRK
jgi:adenylate cyclase